MSIINSDGLNTNWQLNVLRGLQAIADEVAKPLTCAEDGITICSPITGLNVNVHDGTGIPITSTIVGADKGLDVNIINALPLEINLDAANDQVGIYGYDGTTPTPISVDSNGFVNTNASITFPSSLPVTQDPSSNPWTVDGTVITDAANSSVAICGTDGVTNNVAISVSSSGEVLTQSSTLDGLGNAITSTVAGADTGLDVNVIGGTMAVTQSTSPWIVNTNSVVRVPAVLRTTGGSTIPPGARSFSIFNAGSGTASILGGTNNLLPGEEVDFVAGGNDVFGLINFNGNGVTTLVVTYVS
jgi:hypothetical protein